MRRNAASSVILETKMAKRVLEFDDCYPMFIDIAFSRRLLLCRNRRKVAIRKAQAVMAEMERVEA